jgi:hypothetical protein
MTNVTFLHSIISVIPLSFVVVVVTVIVTDDTTVSAAVIYLPHNRGTSHSGPGHWMVLLRAFVVVPCPSTQTFK